MRIYLELEIRRVDCKDFGKVKQEKLAWLADNPFVTKRFANKIRVIQRRSCGLRDEEYLRLKVLTCMLDAI